MSEPGVAEPGVAEPGAAPQTARGRLEGLWRLVSYTDVAASGARTPVFGAPAKGWLEYRSDGRMMVLVTGEGRPRFHAAWDAIPPADKAAAYDRLIAYAGRYRDLGDRVVHEVETCWLPNWEGRALERLVIPAGAGRIILRTPPGRPPLHELLWERIG